MSERRRATPDEVKALSHPLRLRVLALCMNESLSNKELADRLHVQPATLLHHVRTLVRTGFLVAEPVRRGARGSTVRPYRATDKSWTIDIGGPRETTGTKIAAVDAAFSEMHAAPAGELGPLLLYTLRASRAGLEKMMDTVVAELKSLEAAAGDTEEPVWTVLFATYPSAR